MISRVWSQQKISRIILLQSLPTEVHAIAIEEELHVGEKRRRGASARHVAPRQHADDDKINFRQESYKDRSRALQTNYIIKNA